MNTVNLIGRLIKDPDISFININGEQKKMAKYTLAVGSISKKQVNFILCSVIDKGAEWAEKYIKKGSKVAVVGSIETSSYKKYGIDIIKVEINVKEQYFA